MRAGIDVTEVFIPRFTLKDIYLAAAFALYLYLAVNQNRLKHQLITVIAAKLAE